MAIPNQASPLLSDEKNLAPPPQPIPYPSSFNSVYIPYEQIQQPDEAHRRRRAAHFLAITALILFLWGPITHFVWSTMFGPHQFRHHLPGPHHCEFGNEPMDVDYEGPPPHHHPGHPHGLPLPGDFDSAKCVSGDDWDFPEEFLRDPNGNWPSNLATTQLEVPVDNALLFLFSHGSLAQGNVQILPAGEAGDNVSVDVKAYYYTREALDRVTVCGLQSATKGNGLGIYTPHSHHHNRHDIVHFHLTVYLPPGAESRFIPNFLTRLPLFAQSLEGISPAFEFGNVTLVSANAPIGVEDVVADQVIVHTSNAPIRGSFNTTSELIVTTSNGPIDVNVASFNDDPSKKHSMVLHTSNSKLTATVFLLNTTGLTSAFDASTTTSNSPLAVEYASLPPAGSLLNAVARTSNSPARLTLPSAFEGSFLARTSLLGASVDRTDVEDPTGRGRPRRVEMNVMRRGIAYGRTLWEPSEHEDGKAGFASVSTSNSPVQLVL